MQRNRKHYSQIATSSLAEKKRWALGRVPVAQKQDLADRLDEIEAKALEHVGLERHCNEQHGRWQHH